MARDVRQGIAGKDRCKYFGHTIGDYNKLTRNEKAKGVFYSNDNEPFSVGYDTTASDTQVIVYRIKLETYDYVADLEVNDYVLLNGDYWLVESIVAIDVNDNAKPFKRAPMKTIIGLKR